MEQQDGATPPRPPADTGTRGEMNARYARLCGRFEEMMEEWAATAEVDAQKKEWPPQLAAMALSAQRVAALRIALIESAAVKDTGEGSDEDIQSESTALRSHWEALAREAGGDPGAAAG